MKKYRITGTDLSVSRMALGTWHLGGSWDESPLTSELCSRAQSLISTAIQGGINMIDLADIYTWGKSDEVVGTVLADQSQLRDQLVLQAKCGIVMGDQVCAGSPAHYDFSSEHIVAALEGTLQRLQTDRVELLLLHRPDPLVEPLEVAKAFDQLHTAGKVRWFGVSNHTAAQIKLLKKNVQQPLVANQLELNLLHHHLITDGMLANSPSATFSGADGTFDYCRLHDMTVQAWSPLARGQLVVPADDADENVQAVAREVARLAEVHSTTPECIAIAWLLRHPAEIQPILGTMNPHRLAATVAADDVNLSRLEWYGLLAASRGAGVP